MHADKKSLSEILSIDTRLVAPLFQRSYVWNEDENWVPLWQALVEVFERRVAQENGRPYFLGALVLGSVKGQTGSVPCREIIDGQQRMTTIQVFMHVARKLFLAHDFDHSAKQLEKLTRNDLESESDEQFKVWPTNLDRQAFRDVMSDRPSHSRIGEAAVYFDRRVKEWIQPTAEGARERANALVAAVKNDLVFVAIDLENDDDGQLIFETLNSLGTPLQPSDLVKNLLFREAIAEGLDAERLYNDHWLMFELESAYWSAEVKVGRRSRPRLDVFLQYFLTYKTEKEPHLAHQFRDYRDAFRSGSLGTTEEAIADFVHHARLFRAFDEAKDGASGNLRYVLEILEASVPNPLILGIYSNVPEVGEREAMLGIVESYLVRRFLCGLTTKNYNRVTADLIGSLRRSGWTLSSFGQAFLTLEGNSTAWPLSIDVIYHMTSKPAYGNIRAVGIGYVLSRVEASLRSDKSEHRWNARSPLTVEHIMPQKWDEHWPLTDPLDKEAEQKRKDSINRMGNLTVLTRKLNQSISNSAWLIKRQHLNEHTVLKMNSDLARHDAWTENEILQRSARLGMRFCQIWARPGEDGQFDDVSLTPNEDRNDLKSGPKSQT